MLKSKNQVLEGAAYTRFFLRLNNKAFRTQSVAYNWAWLIAGILQYALGRPNDKQASAAFSIHLNLRVKVKD